MSGKVRSSNERSFQIKSGQGDVRVGQDMSSQVKSDQDKVRSDQIGSRSGQVWSCQRQDQLRTGQVW